ncbi:suppressor protein SRP40-like [Trichogramma pretiosum]|uniref:suppressor protein SRP40-like n=1 Tax=Trichogramma pretiosum TaxID=7493 RepID=UPI0006C9C0FD|nr:suppressor protein SRP40-like [Trichogramma pretiosum]
MLRSSAAVSVLTSTLLLSLLLLMPLDASTTHTASLNCCFSELSDVVAAVAGAAAGSDAVMLNEDDDDNMTSFDIHLRPSKNVTLEATTWPEEEDGEKVVEVPFGSLETDWSRLMLLLQELRQPEGTSEDRHQTEQHLLRLVRLVIKAFQNLAADRDRSQTTPDAFDNFTDIYTIETSTEEEEEEESVAATTTLYTNESVQYDEPLQISTLTFNSSLRGNKSNMDQVENDEDPSSEYFFNLSFPNDEAKSDDNVNDVTEAKTSSDTTESSLKNLLSRLQRRNNTRPDSEINAPEAEQELVSTSSSSSSSNDASSLLNVLNEDWSIDGFSARSKKEENLTQEILTEERNMGETTTTATMALAETSTMIGLDSNATTTTMLPDNITSVAGENQTGAVARYEDDWKSPMPETTGSQETTTTTTMTTITSDSSRRASGFMRRLVSSSPLVLLNKEDSDHQRKPRHEDASTTGSSGSSSSSSAANLQKSSSGKWSVLQEQ